MSFGARISDVFCTRLPSFPVVFFGGLGCFAIFFATVFAPLPHPEITSTVLRLNENWLPTGGGDQAMDSFINSQIFFALLISYQSLSKQYQMLSNSLIFAHHRIIAHCRIITHLNFRRSCSMHITCLNVVLMFTVSEIHQYSHSFV